MKGGGFGDPRVCVPNTAKIFCRNKFDFPRSTFLLPLPSPVVMLLGWTEKDLLLRPFSFQSITAPRPLSPPASRGRDAKDMKERHSKGVEQ